MDKTYIEKFENIIGYSFKNKEILKRALTHSSYANENKKTSNERLEFLGDAVLEIVISEYLFLNHPELFEGEMTKLRAHMVCERSLYDFAVKISLNDYLLISQGEEKTGGRTRVSIISDAFEALIGAIYIDSGLKAAKKFILNLFKNKMGNVISEKKTKDYKTLLQEIIQVEKNSSINYKIIKEKGPAHNKVFIAQVFINGKVKGEGKGRTKKQAEQNAAKQAINS